MEKAATAFRLGYALKATISEPNTNLMSMHAWNSANQKKNVAGQPTSKTLAFASCSTTAFVFPLKKVLSV
jgi:hypothetical protein